MTETLTILGISGSLRGKSTNSALLRAAGSRMPDDAILEIFDLHPIPLYDGDVEAAGMPETVQALRTRIKKADALLIATPEYNHSVPGVLKNAIDWASRPPDQPFAGKPVALFGGAAGFGSVRAQLHLREIMTALGSHVLPKPDVWVSTVWDRFDADMKLTDEKVGDQIAALVEALVAFTKRIRG